MPRTHRVQRSTVVSIGLLLLFAECVDTNRFTVRYDGGSTGGAGGQSGAGGRAGAGGHAGTAGTGGSSGAGGGGGGSGGSGGSCGAAGGTGGTSGCTELQSDDGNPCHVYRFCGSGQDWFVAKSECKTWGGYLAAVGSSDEDAELHTKLVGLGFPSLSGFWVGLHRKRMYTEGLLVNESTTTSALDATWLWDGTSHSSTFTNWCTSPAEPTDTHHMNAGPYASCVDADPTDGEECTIYNGCAGNGWVDAICCDALPYICERE